MSITNKTIVAGIVICGVTHAVNASENTKTATSIPIATNAQHQELLEKQNDIVTPDAFKEGLKTQKLEPTETTAKAIRKKQRHMTDNVIVIWWDSLWS
ncbi:hypothetical protein [Paraglaciecola sp. 20A4]|uniref:hypothetical protein n=1 Tax=Paraglaciecola sp. 20A4 TaxID=2687288 RepID=UPI00140B0142|nr:hypothetical protein [Paraglaciecola sp. 20A4]